MGSETLLYDTRDDRRELWHLLHRVPPLWRICWLECCCQRVVLQGTTRNHPVVSQRMQQITEEAYQEDRSDQALTNQVYYDFWILVHQWQLQPLEALLQAEQMAQAYSRGQRRRDFFGFDWDLGQWRKIDSGNRASTDQA